MADRYLEYLPLDELVGAPANPKGHDDEGIAASVDRFGFVEVPTLDERTGRLVAGHGRRDALLAARDGGKPAPDGVQVLDDGRWAVPVLRGWHSADDEDARAYLVGSNHLVEAGGWVLPELAQMLQELQAGRGLEGTGYRDGDLERLLAQLADDGMGGQPGGPANLGALRTRFVVPPFSVLDARQGYWQDRKRAWLALGIRSELGREHMDTTVVQTEWMQRGPDAGGSIFDPVLCELAYRWYCPPGGRVLDPFAGGSVRGVVAGLLGRQYTGVDLRADQVAANQAQATLLCNEAGVEGPAAMPTWVVGDSTQLAQLVPDDEADLVFTCPPYYDLERYSDDPADLSNAGTYAQFLTLYEQVLGQALAKLAPNRWAVLVVGEVRGRHGYCHGLVPDTVRLVEAQGLHLYNDAVLVTAVGSLPLRAASPFVGSRKLGRSHQAVLVFVKGSAEAAAKACGEISLPSEITV